MNKLIFSMSSLLFVVACGDMNQNEVIDISKLNASKTDGESESLALAGRQSLADMKGAKRLREQALGSFVRYRNYHTGEWCSGALAYEHNDDVKYLTSTSTVNVYFYTAAHCLEKRTPLGHRVSKTALFPSESSSFKKPYENQQSDSVPVNLNLERAENIVVDGKSTDVVRIFQRSEPVTVATSKYLPSCPGFTGNINQLQAVGFRSGGTSEKLLNWANFSRSESEASLPNTTLSLLRLASNDISFNRARGVKARAGDSGAPVFAIELGKNNNEVEEYVCLYGVITRELWVRPSACLGNLSECGLKGEALYEKLRAGGKTWQKTGTQVQLPTSASGGVDKSEIKKEIEKMKEPDSQKKPNDDKRKKDEEDKRKKAEDDKRKKDEEDKRKKAEDDKRKKDEEDKRKKAEDDKRKKDEEDKRKKAEDDKRKKDEEEKKKKQNNNNKKR